MCHGVRRQVEMQSEVQWALDKRASLHSDIQSVSWHHSETYWTASFTARWWNKYERHDGLYSVGKCQLDDNALLKFNSEIHRK